MPSLNASILPRTKLALRKSMQKIHLVTVLRVKSVQHTMHEWGQQH